MKLNEPMVVRLVHSILAKHLFAFLYVFVAVRGNEFIAILNELISTFGKCSDNEVSWDIRSCLTFQAIAVSLVFIAEALLVS